MKRALKNANMKPLSHSTYLRLQVLCESFYDADEKLHYLNDLFLDDLKAFIPGLLSQVDMKYLILVFSIILFTVLLSSKFQIPIMMVLGVKQMLSILLVIGEQHAPECVMCVVPTPEVHMDEQLLLCLKLVTLFLVLYKLLPILTLVHIEVLCHRLIMLTTARKQLLLDDLFYIYWFLVDL